MAVNYSNVTFGSPVRGWTAGSIAPKTPVTAGPVANIPTSGNIPANITTAMGNLQGEQAFRNFLSNLIMPQQQQPMVMFPPPNPADEIRAKTEQAQQQAAQNAALVAQRQLSIGNQQLLNYPMISGGMSPMGLGAQRAALQQNQFSLENQLANANAAAFGAPRMNGWMGGF